MSEAPNQQTPVAATGTPPATSTSTTHAPPAAAADWTSGFDDDRKGWAQNKGYKNATDLVDAYRSLETFHGVPKERLLKLPEKADAPEWGDVYDRLGRPKDAKEYDIKPPEGQQADEKFNEWARGTFHKLGLSKKQGESLVQAWNELQSNAMKATNEAETTKITQEVEGLRKEWGAAFDQNVNIVERAAKTFGMTDQQLVALKQSLGAAGSMKFLHNIGSRLGEDSYVGGEGKTGGHSIMTPEGAKSRINELKKDAGFRARITKGDLEAKAEWDRLHEWAHPEETEL